jgi:catechol 2,3-dioxygenase-like lactoylglutathione lyase family enzyme
MQFIALDHVQLAMPRGEEAAARAFYGELLGMQERPKPAGRGGCWFHSGPVEIHLGVMPDFAPATKAHPGIIVGDLDALVARLEAAGYAVSPGFELPGRRRVFCSDCFGNRLEWIGLT